MAKKRPKGVPAAAGAPSTEKRVFGSAGPSGEKRPREAPDTRANAHLRFRFDRVDHKHWPLHRIQNDHHEKLLKRLSYFEQLTVEDARRNDILADYDMSTCPNQQARTILQNQYEGQDSLTRLRVEPHGALRLFGIREGNEIHVVWWDPTHAVWPDKNVR